MGICKICKQECEGVELGHGILYFVCDCGYEWDDGGESMLSQAYENGKDQRKYGGLA